MEIVLGHPRNFNLRVPILKFQSYWKGLPNEENHKLSVLFTEKAKLEKFENIGVRAWKIDYYQRDTYQFIHKFDAKIRSLFCGDKVCSWETYRPDRNDDDYHTKRYYRKMRSWRIAVDREIKKRSSFKLLNTPLHISLYVRFTKMVKEVERLRVLFPTLPSYDLYRATVYCNKKQ